MSAPATPITGGDPNIEEPSRPGTSMKYLGGRPYRQYLVACIIAGAFLFMNYSALPSILLPNQIQTIELQHFFAAYPQVTADVLQQLSGGTYAGADAAELTEVYNQYNAARAASMSFVASIGTFFTMFAQPIVGVISDRWRSRWGRRSFWIAFGGFAGALMMIAMRFSTTVGMIAVTWVIAQVLLNFMQAPLTTTVADRIKEDKLATVSAISGMGTMGGAMLGSIIAGNAFNALGLNAYYIFVVLTAFGAALFVLMAKDRSSLDLHLPPFSWKDFALGFTIALRDADYRWVWLARFVSMLGATLTTTFSLFVLQSYVQPALTQAEANTYATLLSMCSLPGMLISMIVSGKLSDRIGRRKVFVIGSTVATMALLMLPILWPTLPSLFIQTTLNGFALGAFMTVDQALFIDVLPDKEAAGRDLGVANVATNIGQTLAPVLAGVIVAQIVGPAGYRAIYIAAFICMVVAALAIVPVKKVK
ncbi:MULTISPECIES: MFS transporter [unclassified Actinomyces]|uniref:MFS transporter n=1 Tax=unclassified Actinomyces TaxID=2609248 RepID=UPI002016F19B|nr:MULTISPECIES: MFS transporter [unclassified Actinomyces]MCL3777406.1 MFS transporter [Actinomyces sp. AC-20-1]MCL3789072.1 MFS transporter [Actinomyces sp. 187325]MCL3792797.1 MFS transporter [Actinomyces sp. 186855]MCL3793873.1 MFS transporter [Actinomyces sp. 217892]